MELHVEHSLKKMCVFLPAGWAAQMILALEGSYSIEPESVNEDALCETVSKVMDTLLWDRVNEETKRILESITLADLVNEFVREYETEQNMYYI